MFVHRSDVCVFPGGAESGNQNDQDILSAYAGREHITGHHCCPDWNDTVRETGASVCDSYTSYASTAIRQE